MMNYWLMVWNMAGTFSPIVGMMIQSDELIFFRGVGTPPTRLWMINWSSHIIDDWYYPMIVDKKGDYTNSLILTWWIDRMIPFALVPSSPKFTQTDASEDSECCVCFFQEMMTWMKHGAEMMTMCWSKMLPSGNDCYSLRTWKWSIEIIDLPWFTY